MTSFRSGFFTENEQEIDKRSNIYTLRYFHIGQWFTQIYLRFYEQTSTIYEFTVTLFSTSIRKSCHAWQSLHTATLWWLWLTRRPVCSDLFTIQCFTCKIWNNIKLSSSLCSLSLRDFEGRCAPPLRSFGISPEKSCMHFPLGKVSMIDQSENLTFFLVA